MAQRKINVVAMINNDMTGYPNPKDSQCVIGVTRDSGSKGVDQSLSDFMAVVIEGYTPCEPRDTFCNYACSDYASFAAAGYSSCFPQESGNYSPIHTQNDLPSNLDVDYALNFVRLDIGFIVELAYEAMF
jgi:bacterial leucyl aminopeptidase